VCLARPLTLRVWHANRSEPRVRRSPVSYPQTRTFRGDTSALARLSVAVVRPLARMDDRYHGIIVAASAEWGDEPQRVGLQLLTNRSECTEVRPRLSMSHKFLSEIDQLSACLARRCVDDGARWRRLPPSASRCKSPGESAPPSGPAPCLVRCGWSREWSYGVPIFVRVLDGLRRTPSVRRFRSTRGLELRTPTPLGKVAELVTPNGRQRAAPDPRLFAGLRSYATTSWSRRRQQKFGEQLGLVTARQLLRIVLRFGSPRATPSTLGLVRYRQATAHHPTLAKKQIRAE
jgi:hypothetical protein